MNHYKAPLEDMYFVLYEILKAGNIANIEQFEDATEDMQRAVLEEAAKLAENVLQPINASGDREGCQYDPETKAVTTPAGFKEAYQTYQQGGWSALASPVEHGGQGLPHFLKVVVDEMCCSTNLSFGMYPGLSHGSIDALTIHGNEHQQAYFLPKLVAGEWTGTMCLTEPHCGTDLGLIKTKAEPNADGSYAITGNKVWITGGDHDLAENIVHLVLAKLPDAPAGSKGISLFVVPKFMEDGSRNPAFCGGLEHKMGIKASATCVMNFEGATGWLVGKENEGLKCMFTMMNAARIMVGMQGLGLAETGYQVSLAFAKDRLQSRSLAGPKNPDGPADSILVHPDVRRMILKQKVLIEGGRAMAYWSAYQQDLAHAATDEAEREKADDLFQIMTPIVKSFLTDEGYFSCDSALQSMGGNGFTQDWPVEQLVRDGRIARIYEGTNGIQALDLIGRKLTMRGGRLPRTYLAAMNELLQGASAEHKKLAEQFIAKLTKTLMGLAKSLMADPEEAGAAATPLLRMFALTSLAVFWARMAEQADDEGTKGRYSADYLSGKKKAADHFFRLYLPEMDALAADIEAGKATLMDFAEAEF